MCVMIDIAYITCSQKSKITLHAFQKRVEQYHERDLYIRGKNFNKNTGVCFLRRFKVYLCRL